MRGLLSTDKCLRVVHSPAVFDTTETKKRTTNPVRCEASTGFEPVMRVLQTLALPLGHDAGINKSERAMGFEPTTFSLARRRSTTEPRPQVNCLEAESAESQNRTDDTAIFSRVLYQLSYLGQLFGC